MATRRHVVVSLAVVGLALGPATAPSVLVPQLAPVAAAEELREYTVLVEEGADARAAAAAVEESGGTVVRENPAVGALVVRAPATGFVERVSAEGSVLGAAAAFPIGRVGPPGAGPPVADEVEEEHRAPGSEPALPDVPAVAPPALDPLDALLWGLRAVRADAARPVQAGDARVAVGILDTGVDRTHPDLAPNLDLERSRNFAPDIPVGPDGTELDGPCEVESCLDPPGTDPVGHGTHVAGTVAAAADGVGVSGVAPGVTIVDLRASQDAGLLFVQPVVDALTYGADIGLDVINMSFYVDPWLYNCTANPADPPEARIAQATTVEAVSRALRYAHERGVTLVGSLGNDHVDLGQPRVDTASPNFPFDTAYPRPVDNADCLVMPIEGPHVVGVSALGPSGAKADYSNYGTEQISLAAPGGWLFDGATTPEEGRVDNLVLSTVPREILLADGDITADGLLTEAGVAAGVLRDCAGGTCGYYGFKQGTSMAAPHVSAVAALVVSEYGVEDPQRPGTLAMDPAQVERILLATAAPRPCPSPALVTYPGRPPEFDALCAGGPGLNGFYGHGVVDAAAAVGVAAD